MDASHRFMSELCCAYGNARDSAMINKSLYGSYEQWLILLSCITSVAIPISFASICMFSSCDSKY